MKRALIIGASGQDGTLLARLLKEKGYEVAGVSRRKPSANVDEAIALDVRDARALREVVRRARPDEIYYLAAYHRSSQGAPDAQDEASQTFDVNLNSYVAVLETAVALDSQPRIFYACTSLIFGDGGEGALNEASPARPACLYSIAKLAGRHVSEHFRHHEGAHVSVGILFNHESALRQPQFLSRRIVEDVRAVQRGERKHIVIGDAGARCDWGYAGDYVEAMWRMLQADRSDTYVVATGELHTVADWIDASCKLAGLDSSAIVREDRSLLTRSRPVIRGDSGRLTAATGWTPRTSFEAMVARMYRQEA